MSAMRNYGALFLGEGTARVELFEGHARSGDVRMSKYRGDQLPWAGDPNRYVGEASHRPA